MSDKDTCSKCGYPWASHEFAVPAPYCPTNDEDAEYNKQGPERFKKIIDEIRSGKYVDPLKRKNIQFVLQNEGVNNTWFDYQTGFKSYDEASSASKRADLTYRIIKREIVETVIK
jgi:hypothetical protein